MVQFPPDLALQKKLVNWSQFLVWIMLGIGVLVIAGWQFNVEFFKQPVSRIKPMNPLGAAGIILAALAFLCLTHTNRHVSPWPKYVGYFFALLVLLIGMFVFLGNLHVDGILYPDKVTEPAKDGSNYIVPSAAFCFILAGITLFLLNYETTQRQKPAFFTALLMGCIALFTILGYLYEVKLFYGWFTYLPMSIQASVCFLFLSIAAFFAYPGQGIMKEFTSIYAGSVTARRLIPAAIFLPILLGLFRMLGKWAGFFTPEFGVALLVLGIIVLFLAIIWYNASLLNKRDSKSKEGLDALLASEEQVQTIFAAAPDAIIVIDQNGNIVKWNSKAETLFGWTAIEVVGRRLSGIIIPQRFRESHNKGMNRFLMTGESSVFGKTIEIQALRKDNTEFDVALNISPTLVNNKHLFIGFVRDITERVKAEEKFRNLLESAPDAMIIVDSNGIIKLVNAQTELMFEYNRSELLEQPLEMLIPDRFRGVHPGYRNKFFELPKTRAMGIGLELYGLKKNRKEFPVEISLSPLQTEEGTLVSAAIRDITERKKAEEKFKNLLESAPDAIVIVSETGVILLVNAQTEKLFGYTRAEMIGKNVELLMPMRYSHIHQGHRSNFFKSPKVRSMGEGFELFGRNKNADEFPVEISLSPLETEEGLLVSAAIRDISEKKQMELQIREANINLERKVQDRTTELARKNKELEQFAYVASHDLQEPLRTTSSFVELFKEKYLGKLDEETDTMLHYISQASDRMKILIKDLLDYSRIGRKTVVEEVDCNMILSDVKADLTAFILETGTEIHHGSMPVIRGYPTEIKQLFQNLITNSIKFRREGLAPVIHINAESKKGYWQFAVRDNGIGIEEIYKDRIFIIFQRLHTRSEYEGSGIGLAHCKKIVELHGGKIWVDSVPGEGSIFYFTIYEMQEE